MTDYNDGKWHGWNGGECPVDPDAEVEAIYMDGDDVSASSPMVDPAYAFDWAYENKFRLIAFRVTKPTPPKPREWWVVRHKGDEPCVFNYPPNSSDLVHRAGEYEITHVREVLPE